MSSAQIKEALKKQIEEADDRLLKMVHAMMQAYSETDDAFSFDEHGNPTDAQQMRKELEEEIEKAKQGKYIRLDDLKKKSEKWMKGTRQNPNKMLEALK